MDRLACRLGIARRTLRNAHNTPMLHMHFLDLSGPWQDAPRLQLGML